MNAQENFTPALIPAPQEMTLLGNWFEWDLFDEVVCPPQSTLTREWILPKITPFFKAGTQTRTGTLLLVKDNLSTDRPESYTLDILKHQIIIRSGTDIGLQYGLTTLLQTVQLDSSTSKYYSPCLHIQDYPRYTYRGMHLDVCRHFFPVAFIKRYIDYLAMYKFNTFHWHLTDDQGWRIEIKRYPKLTDTGAWRSETLLGKSGNETPLFDGMPYGGFYTQEEIREVVRYATAQGITIIPEIELPGHALAALSAYPELSCTGGPFQPATTWGVFDDVYCTKEETITFLEHVLDEVIDLFPGPYIHIGGDECPKTRWKSCPNCQKNIQTHGLADEHELQSWFIKQIATYLQSRDRRIIGWDEILEGGLAPDATVMSWRGVAGGMEAAAQGHEVIMTPGNPCYFDHYQSRTADQPLAIGGYNPLEAVYTWDPVPADLDTALHQYILGGQGNVWTEYMLDEKHVEYMIFPRITALAETLWSNPEQKDYAHFLDRVDVHQKRWHQADIRYFPYYR
ncbi:MAG: beta-N-acetylhexosaminidase [Saprospiraceae bacterium]|nr:beta-N-acetylhexosaminidase [Saprospiraceae bacterium]